MTHTPTPPGAGLLPFGGLSVRYLVDPDGTFWLVARDLLRILRLDVDRANPGRWLRKTASADLGTRTVLSAQGPQRSIVIKPGAAIDLTAQRSRPVDAAVRTFLDREVTRLAESG